MTPIDLSKVKVCVLSNSIGYVRYQSVGYLLSKNMPLQNIAVCKFSGSIIENRNKVIIREVLPVLDKFEWFLFLDKDVGLIPESEPFLDDVPEHVVGANYNTGVETSWLVPTFHMGIVRIRSSVFGKLESPWFMVEYNQEGTSLKSCECNYLRRNILEQGFTITNRGMAEHEPSRSWHHSPVPY